MGVRALHCKLTSFWGDWVGRCCRVGREARAAVAAFSSIRATRSTAFKRPSAPLVSSRIARTAEPRPDFDIRYGRIEKHSTESEQQREYRGNGGPVYLPWRWICWCCWLCLGKEDARRDDGYTLIKEKEKEANLKTACKPFLSRLFAWRCGSIALRYTNPCFYLLCMRLIREGLSHPPSGGRIKC